MESNFNFRILLGEDNEILNNIYYNYIIKNIINNDLRLPALRNFI